MRIWIQSSAFLPTPPKTSGGLESVVAELASALAIRGQDVTLFGLKGSEILGIKVVTVRSRGRPYATETAIVDRMEREPRPDVLFDHSLFHLAQARWPSLPAVTMSHGEAKLFKHARNPVFVSAAHGRWHGVEEPQYIPVNVDPSQYIVGGPMKERGYALFMGRFLPYKRPHLAIAFCLDAGWPLKLAGPITDTNYFRDWLQPYFREGRTEYVGELQGETKRDILSRASCLLFTSEAQEPAGVVMLEAMASGTPVLAFNHGANKEYIIDGTTGFLATEDAEFAAYVRSHAWNHIDPIACREHVERNFTPEMAAGKAELLLQRAAKGERW